MARKQTTVEKAEISLEDALHVLRADYWNDVRAIAEELKTEAKDQHFDREEAIEWLEQTIDGHHRVIYTAEAQLVLRFSENDGAYIEEFGADGAVEDGAIAWSKLAYMAMLHDVYDHLSSVGVDINADDLGLSDEAEEDE